MITPARAPGGHVKQYQHTQVGYLIIAATGAVIILAAVILSREFSWIAVAAIVIIAIALVLFSSLTVTIEAGQLEARFGPGPIRKRIRLSEIESCRTVRNHWYYGWGIRTTPHGILYNVSGFQAVEIQLRTGGNVRIGTDEPLELEKAIREAIGQAS
jgi:hypothetical protein